MCSHKSIPGPCSDRSFSHLRFIEKIFENNRCLQRPWKDIFLENSFLQLALKRSGDWAKQGNFCSKFSQDISVKSLRLIIANTVSPMHLVTDLTINWSFIWGGQLLLPTLPFALLTRISHTPCYWLSNKINLKDTLATKAEPGKSFSITSSVATALLDMRRESFESRR